MIVNLADACIVIGEIERENASLKERIAELEADAEVREEANRSLLSFGMKTGMERAADIVQSEYGPDYVKGDVAAGTIRKELDLTENKRIAEIEVDRDRMKEPKSWLWRRDYATGGYTEKVFLLESDAVEYAKDGDSLKSPDTVTPLYSLTLSKELENE